jgi:hypothetical protein
MAFNSAAANSTANSAGGAEIKDVEFENNF